MARRTSSKHLSTEVTPQAVKEEDIRCVCVPDNICGLAGDTDWFGTGLPICFGIPQWLTGSLLMVTVTKLVHLYRSNLHSLSAVFTKSPSCPLASTLPLLVVMVERDRIC